MTPDTKLLNPAETDGTTFCRQVCSALARYEVRRAGFNLAANSSSLDPGNHAFMVYPEQAHGLITASIQALQELAEGKEVSRPTRERFLLEDTKDRLRAVQGQMGATEYRELYERSLGHLSAKFTGIESLAFTAPHFAKGPR